MEQNNIETLQQLKNEFGQNRNYSTIQIHEIIDNIIRIEKRKLYNDIKNR